MTPRSNSNFAIRHTMTITTTRIGIIGAGSSGLAALKWCLETWARDDVKGRNELQVVVFEKQDQVGGVWYVQRLWRDLRGS
jgi:cation diffusion facilitator CzcD-associated flavoprotein CzcO